MTESVYSMVVLVGSSTESWERAAAAAIETASGTLRDLRVARIVEQDVHIEPGKPLTWTRVSEALAADRARPIPAAKLVISPRPAAVAAAVRLPMKCPGYRRAVPP